VRLEPAIESLRAQIEKIEGRSRRVKSVLPFGITEGNALSPDDAGNLSIDLYRDLAGILQASVEKCCPGTKRERPPKVILKRLIFSKLSWLRGHATRDCCD
jgi:hypothetical protein